MTESQHTDGLTVNEKGIPVLISRSDSTPIRATAKELVALEHDILEESDLLRAGYTVSATPSPSAGELAQLGGSEPALETPPRRRP